MTRTFANRWAAQHPVAAFFGLTYALSWGLWLPLVLGYSGTLRSILFVGGAFGPAVAGALVTGLSGHKVGAWLRRRMRWRVAARWWMVALVVPVVLTGTASAAYALLGHPVDVMLLPARLGGYLPALALAALVGGGQEELGWRGFALPHLERRFGPARATLLLGTIWALWHLPIVAANRTLQHGLEWAALWPVLLLSLASVVGYAFVLTWLFNRTGSVLMAMLLHAGFNTANALLVPLPAEAVAGSAYQTLSVTMTLTLGVAVLLLVAATGGRLGYTPSQRVEARRGAGHAAAVVA